jgi:large subunit ribosomal protein L29
VNAADLRGLNVQELAKQLEEAHQELFNLRFRLSTMQLKNHRELRQVKKNIARINTIIREKELGLS